MEKQLPKNWVECSLGEIAEWGSGGTPNRGIPSYYNGTIPWLKTGDLNDGLITEVKEYITELGLKNSSAKIFPKNSVVIAMYGATIGKTGMINFASSTNQACAVAVPYFNMNKFIYLFLKSEKENFIEKGKGGAQPNISQAVIKSHRINLPPLPEQNRIVEKFDNMFNQLETIKSSMANIPLLLKVFRQQVLSQAVTGKLTSEWREGKKLEPINIKLDVNNDYQLHTLPEGWNHAIISNISKVKGGKRLPKGEELTNENTGYPYIRARDLKQGTVLTENLMYLEEKIQALIKNYIVNEGDLYITIVGAKIGDAGIIPKEMNGANLTENAVKITDLNDNVFNKYFSIWLRCPICQSNIQKTIMSAAQGKLALTRINLLPIYLPSLKEQQEIVSRVEILFAKADTIEQQFKTLKQKIDTLPQALLHKAFKGELTEQLESDGDAKELLKAIENLKNIKGIKPKAYKVPKEKLGLVAEPK